MWLRRHGKGATIRLAVATSAVSEVAGNTAAHGGGIFSSGGSVTLSHSHVTGNHVDNCEPAIAGCTN